MRLFKICLMSLLLAFALSAHAQVESLFHNSGDPVIGNPKGEITIVEFFDYQCGYCKTMAPIIDNIVRSNPNVRIVFKEFPIRGAMSEYAAAVALAANKQGKYHEFNHALLSVHQPLTPSMINGIAQQLGIKVNLKDQSLASQIQDNLRLADALQLNGTPAFFIGRTNARNMNEVKFIYGAMSQSELQSEINKLSR